MKPITKADLEKAFEILEQLGIGEGSDEVSVEACKRVGLPPEGWETFVRDRLLKHYGLGSLDDADDMLFTLIGVKGAIMTEGIFIGVLAADPNRADRI